MIYDILRSTGVKETDQGGNEGPAHVSNHNWVGMTDDDDKMKHEYASCFKSFLRGGLVGKWVGGWVGCRVGVGDD